jgi:hypothetical protein
MNLKIKIYKTKIFPVVLYGCETWSRIIEVEMQAKRAFENRILMQIFSSKWDKNGK